MSLTPGSATIRRARAIGGGVVTYSAQGRQYIAVASGSPSSFWVDAFPGAPTIVIFALARQNP